MIKKLIRQTLKFIPGGESKVLPALRFLLHGTQVAGSDLDRVPAKIDECEEKGNSTETENCDVKRIPELVRNRCYEKKIFIVGNNKTGTSSLRKYFEDMGYRVAPQATSEKIYFSYYLDNNEFFFKEMYDYIDCHEVFQDIPFSLKNFLEPLLKNFPGERYVYTDREAYDWYISLLNHHSQSAGFTYQEYPDKKEVKFNIHEILDKVSDWRYRGHDLVRFMIHRYNLDGPLQLYSQSKYMRYHELHRDNAKKLLSNHDAIFLDLTKDNKAAIKLASFLGFPEGFIPPMVMENQRRPKNSAD